MSNRFKDARTKYNKHGHESVKDVSKATGITSSLIDDLETSTVTRDVGYSKIKMLAEYYGVSADYLLGLSEHPTADLNAAAAAEYTGLSLEAVKMLHDLHNTRDEGMFIKGEQVSYISWLSKILESTNDFYRLMDEICSYMVYGGVLPQKAYQSQECDLSVEEWARFHSWANGRKQEIISRDEARELHLQLAGEKLKGICRKILEKTLAEKKEAGNDGKH